MQISTKAAWRDLNAKEKIDNRALVSISYSQLGNRELEITSIIIFNDYSAEGKLDIAL